MSRLSIPDHVSVAWWVGDFCHRLWRDHRYTSSDLVRRAATFSRARGVIGHDRVLNIEQHKARARK